MTAVEVSVVHDHAGRIISVSQFAHGVRARVLGGEGQLVLMTTADHAVVPELIRTHKVDIERGRLVEIADNTSGASSRASRDRDALAALLLPKQDRD
jgi:predicted neutral ceramidase superfamily lipid hydrolase